MRDPYHRSDQKHGVMIYFVICQQLAKGLSQMESRGRFSWLNQEMKFWGL